MKRGCSIVDRSSWTRLRGLLGYQTTNWSTIKQALFVRKRKRNKSKLISFCLCNCFFILLSIDMDKKKNTKKEQRQREWEKEKRIVKRRKEEKKTNKRKKQKGKKERFFSKNKTNKRNKKKIKEKNYFLLVCVVIGFSSFSLYLSSRYLSSLSSLSDFFSPLSNFLAFFILTPNGVKRGWFLFLAAFGS